MKITKKIVLILMMVIMIAIVAPNIIPEIQDIYTVEAASVKLNKTNLTLNVGESYVLKVKGTKKKVKWQTSNKKVATVNSNGKIKAKKAGKVTITAKIGSTKYKCKVKVENPKISTTSLTMNVGESSKLKIKGTSQKVKWSTSNKKVATVNSNGKIKAKKAGKVTITAKIGSTKYKCKVKVEDPKINQTDIIIYVGDTYTLKITGTTQPVTWTCLRSIPAIVDANGKVSAIKKGNTQVVAYAGKKKFLCNIHVYDKPYMNKTSLNLKLGEEKQLDVENYRGNVTWSSSDNSKVTVTSYGEIKAVGSGTAIITAQGEDRKFESKITVEKTYLNTTSKTLKIGEEYDLELMNTSNNIYYNVSWSSSDPSIVTVDDEGKIVAQKSGIAKITAKIYNNTYICNINVEKAYLNTEAVSLSIGENYKLKLQNIQLRGDIEWSSSDSEIVTVDDVGEIVTKESGTAIITANYGGEIYKCVVTVR